MLMSVKRLQRHAHINESPKHLTSPAPRRYMYGILYGQRSSANLYVLSDTILMGVIHEKSSCVRIIASQYIVYQSILLLFIYP